MLENYAIGFSRWESVGYFIVDVGSLETFVYRQTLPGIRFIFRLLRLNHGILYNLCYVDFANH